jgi:medium-chain acyl-[acyl-carrier-protein] hydrolase
MGALVAFELARRLRPMGFEPVHLFASAFRAPHLPSRRPQDRHLLPDQELMEVIRALNGIPLALLENREFLDLILPTLRSDLKAVETYVFPSSGSAILPSLRLRWSL